MLPSNPGGVNPKFRRAISVDALLGRGSIDAAHYTATDFSVEFGPGVPAHALPGDVRRGLFMRTDGSLVATLYLTVNAGTTWTAMAVP